MDSTPVQRFFGYVDRTGYVNLRRYVNQRQMNLDYYSTVETPLLILPFKANDIQHAHELINKIFTNIQVTK